MNASWYNRRHKSVTSGVASGNTSCLHDSQVRLTNSLTVVCCSLVRHLERGELEIEKRSS
jgi:hypothetical protein